MSEPRVLVIAAHPDDIDFACAGTMALWSRQGRHITYLLCTSGEKGMREDLPEWEKMRVREEEQIEAARLVGVQDVLFLRRKDGELENTQGFRRDLVRVMRQVQPQIVFSRDPANNRFDSFYGYHSDHRAVALAVFDALYPAVGNPLFFPALLQEGLKPHRVQEVYFTGSPEPNVWIDIRPVIDLKVKALASHRSQMDQPEELERIVREWAGRTGKGARKGGRRRPLKYAEAFRRLEVPE
ncbi:MAG: PIG-L family deacetylase [Deltaproteobacteria bacterium]|nr:PIG-L family deacetylase [Deltaproteobacteria bacterium]